MYHCCFLFRLQAESYNVEEPFRIIAEEHRERYERRMGELSGER